jgi:hypothetical protein
LHGKRDFLGLAFAKADVRMAVADRYQSAETEAFAAFNDFGAPVYLDDYLFKPV